MNPIPMLLQCPMCGKRHVDRGEFATKPHHTHACQKCGHVWRPTIVHTVGVRFLPGFKDGEAKPYDAREFMKPRCRATSWNPNENGEVACQMVGGHDGDHVNERWSWKDEAPELKLSCSMCLVGEESLVRLNHAKGKLPCSRCMKNPAEFIVTREDPSTKTGFRTDEEPTRMCLHARGQETADTCVKRINHLGMHSNGSGGFWSEGL